MDDLEKIARRLPKTHFSMPNLLWCFMAGAERGIPYAEWKLGNCYFAGRFVEQDFAAARRWYEKAAGQGFYLGQRDLAFMQKRGMGGPIDLTEAAVNFEKASNSCSKSAMEAGEAYLFGLGVTADRRKAMKLFEFATRKHNHVGTEMNAYLSAMDKFPLISPAERHDLLKKEHLSGNLDATFALGVFFLGATHEHCRPEEAFDYFNMAAEKGHIKASIYRARMLMSGEGCKQDAEAALASIDQVIREHGDPEAHYAKGLFYLKGETIPQDFNVALYWMDKAASLGFPQAIHGKAICLSKLLPPADKKISDFAEMLKKAHQQAFGNGIAELVNFFQVLTPPFLIEDPDCMQSIVEAASRGNSLMAYVLGDYYFVKCPGLDDASGLFWTASAIDEGFAEAPFLLAIWMEQHKADQKLYINSLYNCGATFGHERAAFRLASLLHQSSASDKSLSASYYLRAAQLGHAESARCLSHMFRFGDGVSVDENAADILQRIYIEISSSSQDEQDPPPPENHDHPGGKILPFDSKKES